MKGGFIVKDADGNISEVTADQADQAKSEFVSVLRITSEIISGTVRLDIEQYERLPFVFLQVLDIHRDFIKQQTKDNG